MTDLAVIGEKMNKRPASNRVPAILIVLVAAAFAGFRGADPLASQANPWLARDLGRGEAVVWYSFHSGWVVRTRNHLLVFDYVGPNSPSNEPSLESGHVIPEEIAGQNVTVFVSHAHGDHSVPDVERWRRRVPKIRYVWGWEGVGTREDTHFGPERRAVTLDGLKILNIHHEIDGIPESAFLVKTDGLSIIFAGDYAHRHGIANPVFKAPLWRNRCRRLLPCKTVISLFFLRLSILMV